MNDTIKIVSVVEDGVIVLVNATFMFKVDAVSTPNGIMMQMPQNLTVCDTGLIGRLHRITKAVYMRTMINPL